MHVFINEYDKFMLQKKSNQTVAKYYLCIPVYSPYRLLLKQYVNSFGIYLEAVQKINVFR